MAMERIAAGHFVLRYAEITDSLMKLSNIAAT